ncbi:hypothetical protein CSUI_009080 [Cystoisospora suis]|uniref:Uncharacterized protein n=1 Tax=Cystoisospora suis TaxID=483139 RepID=A0A2C6KKD2_9APIC|nr:hypothetical protein CSUI_009080 [Cystoisospora suis]
MDRLPRELSNVSRVTATAARSVADHVLQAVSGFSCPAESAQGQSRSGTRAGNACHVTRDLWSFFWNCREFREASRARNDTVTGTILAHRTALRGLFIFLYRR